MIMFWAFIATVSIIGILFLAMLGSLLFRELFSLAVYIRSTTPGVNWKPKTMEEFYEKLAEMHRRNNR